MTDRRIDAASHQQGDVEQKSLLRGLAEKMQAFLQSPQAVVVEYEDGQDRTGLHRFVVVDNPERRISFVVSQAAQGGGVNALGMQHTITLA